MLIIMHGIVALQEILIPLVLKKTSKRLNLFLSRHEHPHFVDILADAHQDRGRQLAAGTRRPPPPGGGAMWPGANSTVRAWYNPANFSLTPLPPDDPRIEMNGFEGDMEPYGGSYDDYLELFVQFGYVFLFSPVFPLACAVAVLANVFFMYANIYKLCAVFQRPVPRRVKDIGAWTTAFELIGFLSVISNVALIVLSLDLKATAVGEWGWSQEAFFLAVILSEHAIILIRLAYNKFVSSVPQWVRIAQARAQYQARMAYKKEVNTWVYSFVLMIIINV